MEKLNILVLLLVPFFGCSQKSGTSTPESTTKPVVVVPKSGLIFQTGFEPDTKIINQDDKSAEFIGIDRSYKSQNNWNTDLEENLNIGYFNIQYQGGDKSQRLAEIVADPKDPSNNALRFWIKEPNVNPKKGRIQANIYNNNNIKELSYSIRLFLPEDFNTVKSAPFEVKWLTLMEFWNNANWKGEDHQFRLSVNLQKLGKGPSSLKFAVKSQVRDEEADKWKKPYLWDFHNSTYEVPIGKWMTLDVLFIEGDTTTGRFKLSVTPDGESTTVVHDIKNFTHHPDDPSPDGLAHINPFKLYTSDDVINYVTKSGKLLNVYWDDFKLSLGPDIKK